MMVRVDVFVFMMGFGLGAVVGMFIMFEVC